MLNNTINLRVQSSIKAELKNQATRQGLTLSKYIAKLFAEDKFNSIAANIEAANDGIVRYLQSKETSTPQKAVLRKMREMKLAEVTERKPADPEYLYHLSKGLLELVEKLENLK